MDEIVAGGRIMGSRGYRRSWRRGAWHRWSWPGRGVRRWAVVVVGLGVLVGGLVGAAGPYEQTREFRAVAACERHGTDCLDRERGTIVGRRTYTTSTPSTEHSSGSTTTHYEVTWSRADGTREHRDVGSGFYGRAQEGQAADLLVWRGDVVGVEVAGAAERFLPAPGRALGYWLQLAFLGVGVLLWGLLFGWWDGLFMLGFRTFTWTFMSITPAWLGADALAYGLQVDAGFVGGVAFGVFAVVVAGWMLAGSLDF